MTDVYREHPVQIINLTCKCLHCVKLTVHGYEHNYQHRSVAHISVHSVQDRAATALCLGVKGEVRCVSHVITGVWAMCVCVCVCMRCILYLRERERERERMAHIQYNYSQALFFKCLLYLSEAARVSCI